MEETFAAGSKNGKLATIINQCTDKRYCGKMCRLLHAMKNKLRCCAVE